jgi:transposase
MRAILRAHFAEDQVADQDKAEWTKVVADFETSDLSQREFAKERLLSLSNLRYWIYRLRRESRPLVTEPTERSVNKAERRPAKKGLILKPVRMVGSAPKARQGEDGTGLLELALPSGTRLRFPAGTDLDYLRALTTAL